MGTRDVRLGTKGDRGWPGTVECSQVGPNMWWYKLEVVKSAAVESNARQPFVCRFALGASLPPHCGNPSGALSTGPTPGSVAAPLLLNN